MATPPLVLASASPRRRELLGYLGVAYTTLVSDAEEEDRPLPEEFAPLLPFVPTTAYLHPTIRAWRKASAACEIAPESVIIGADTIVFLDGEVLNKPADPEDAKRMLRQLAGRQHTVYTGVVVINGPSGGQTRLAVEESQVEIASLDDETIRAYVASGEPLDKAGAYGIQGLGGKLVRSVTGSYTNVVGLPLPIVYTLLSEAGFSNLVLPAEAYSRWLVDQGKEPLPCPPSHP